VSQTLVEPPGYRFAWGQPNSEAIQAINNSRVATKYLDGLKNHEQVREQIRDVLRQGPALGKNPLEVSGEVRAVLQQHVQATSARAQTIARTEILDSYRAAARETQMANADVLAGWVWMSTLGMNTCPSCIAQHGQLHPLDEPGPDDHPNGACFRMPQTKTWRELGFDIDELEPVLPTPEAWFGGLTEGQQQFILGPKRFELWEAGEYPMSAWSREMHNPGWRRSYGVSPAQPVRAAPAALPQPGGWLWESIKDDDLTAWADNDLNDLWLTATDEKDEQVLDVLRREMSRRQAAARAEELVYQKGLAEELSQTWRGSGYSTQKQARQAYDEWLDDTVARAEAYAGVGVTAQGEARGYTIRRIYRSNQATAAKYSRDELKTFMSQHPPRTFDEWLDEQAGLSIRGREFDAVDVDIRLERDRGGNWREVV
jgi:hypothetical protein